MTPKGFPNYKVLRMYRRLKRIPLRKLRKYKMFIIGIKDLLPRHINPCSRVFRDYDVYRNNIRLDNLAKKMKRA